MATVNGFDKTAFFMGTVGAEHPAELVRTAVSAFTGGEGGVIRPTDLRVTQTDVPSGRLRVAPGGVVIPNNVPGVASESYVGRAPRESFLDVGLNGSGTRTDLIGVRIKDPEYGDFPGPATEEGAISWEFIEPFVFSNVNAAQLAAAREGRQVPGIDYPVYWLNYLVIPPNTGTFTNAMLYPLRRLVQPQTKLVRLMSNPTPEVAMNNELGAIWPDFRPMLRVPVWAVKAWVITTISSVGQRGGAAQGQLTTVLGGSVGAGATGLRANDIGYDLDAPATGGSRHTLVVGGGFPDVRSLAGKDVYLQTEARKLEAANNPGYLVTVSGTQVIYDVYFEQEIVD